MASAKRIGISVRSCRGDGRDGICVHSESCNSVADLKQLLCAAPHNLCADPSRFVLVHQESPSIITSQQYSELFPGNILQDVSAIAPIACLSLRHGELPTLTAVEISPSLSWQPAQPTDAVEVDQPLFSCTSADETALPASSPVACSAASETRLGSCIPVTLSLGARVRIKGLTSKPELNGRTGVVCGAFDEATGRWTVQVDARELQPDVHLALRPANLQPLPIHVAEAPVNISSASDPAPPCSPLASPSMHSSQVASQPAAATDLGFNQATHWRCGLGLTWPKNVDYNSQCPKGHALVTSPLLTSGCHICSHALHSGMLSLGARVRIEGLTSKPELNGRTGVICGAFDEATGRWTVQVDAGGPFVKLRPANMKMCASLCSNTTATVCGRQCANGCSYGICDNCAACHQSAPREHTSGSGGDFPSLGVNALFLKAFKSRWSSVIAEQWTTSQVCNQLLKPLTSRSRGSLCDDLFEIGSTDVGEANMFFSHVWTDKFWSSVDAVLQLIEERGAAALQTTYIWFDIFSTSQHTSVDRPSSWWMDTFKNAIAKMGRLAMVLNPWDNPAALKRAWCVLELFSCASTGGCFEVAMPPAERERFLRCNRIPGLFDKMLSHINSRDATCSRETDRVRIMAAVDQSVGFAAMDSMLLRTLEAWFKEQLQRIAASASLSKSAEVEANALYSLALQHLHSGDFAQGETAARKAVDIRLRYNGALHTETLAAKGALGMLLRRARKLEEARSVCVDVVEGRIQSLGAEHFETFTAWSNLGSCLYDLRKYDEARPILLKVIAFSKRFYGPSHQNTLMVMNTLALVHEESQKFGDADATYSEIVEESKRNLGLSHPSTLGFLHNYADFLFKRRRHSEAEAMFAQCLDGRLRVLGPQHPATLDTKQSLEFCRSLSQGERCFLGMADWDAVLKQRSSLPR